jgi:hypothetical protein
MAVGHVTATSLNLRDAPNGTIIGLLRNGDSAVILEKKDGWVSVSATVDGETKLGWVNAKFVDATVSVPPADDDATPVTAVDGKAIGPDGRSFASVQRNGFFTVGITTLDTWLAGNPAGLNLAPSLMRVLRAVSRNEGRLEAVNSWDTAFLSFGMFQWTAGAKDQPGELAGLLARVQDASAGVFQNFFGRYGLGTELQRGETTGFLTLAGAALKDAADKDQLRDVEWAYRFWRAGHDDTVRACQINLAAARVTRFIRAPVAGHLVGDWLSSEYGIALVLDEHVNRPGHVPGTLKRGIDKLKLSGTDPTGWGDQEEDNLISAYKTAREATKMTDPAKRAKGIEGCVDSGMLSKNRGSFVMSAAAPSV